MARRPDAARAGLTDSSAAEAPVPRREVADRAQEVDFAQVRAERLDEVELRMRALPEQEVTQPLLARRPDHEVGIRLATGVQVLPDLLGSEALGQFLERPALYPMLGDDAAHRVDDLAAAAVSDGEV